MLYKKFNSSVMLLLPGISGLQAQTFKKSSNVKAIGAFMFISALLSNSAIFAHWEPDVKLTYDPDISYPSYNNARNIAAGGDTVHVVWYDHRSGYYLVYYRRSTDSGASWEDDFHLTGWLRIRGSGCFRRPGKILPCTVPALTGPCRANT